MARKRRGENHFFAVAHDFARNRIRMDVDTTLFIARDALAVKRFFTLSAQTLLGRL
jgi:hypothetical protein